MKALNKIIEIVSKIFKKKDIECELEEHCPIYLSYLGVNKDSKEIAHCKNANKLYCRKYRLVDTKKWENLSVDKKLEVIKDMDIIMRDPD